MAIRVCTLGSGSKGNSVLIDNGKNRLLIDAGLPSSCLTKRLEETGLKLEDIDGVLITHEHDDHIKGIENISKTVPVYAHDYTMEIIAPKCKIELKQRMNFYSDSFSIGSFDINTFKTSHDAVYPLGYSISDGDSKVTYATDLGYCSKEFCRVAAGSDLIIIESNHDLDMLLNGKYPAYLKRRIISNRGHLSNDACAIAICDFAKSGTRNFILGHISENNNLPELAYWTNADYLTRQGAEVGGDVKLFVAGQNAISGFIGCK